MEAPAWIKWIGAVLREVPGPTEAWADIIGHLAWPLTIAWIVVRFRHSLRRLLEILIIRFKSDDLGIANVLSVTRNSTLVPLDSGENGGSDAFVTERLLEFMGEAENFESVQRWLVEEGRQNLDIVEFITQSEFADLRQRAFTALLEGGEHG